MPTELIDQERYYYVGLINLFVMNVGHFSIVSLSVHLLVTYIVLHALGMFLGTRNIC